MIYPVDSAIQRLNNLGQVDKLANLGVIVASLSDISEENARGVRARKNLQGVTDRIS